MRKFVVGQNFAEGVEFTHPATDELGGLRPEVKNDDFLLHREERTKLEKMKEGDAKSRFVFASPEGGRAGSALFFEQIANFGKQFFLRGSGRSSGSLSFLFLERLNGANEHEDAERHDQEI